MSPRRSESRENGGQVLFCEYWARQLALTRPALAAPAMQTALDYTDGRASQWLRTARWMNAVLGSERGLRWTAVLADWRGSMRADR